MQKYIKIIGMILVIALVLAFAGCELIQKNDERYNQQIAVEVGDEKVTLRQLMDFFDSNAANYINAGYTAQVVWNALFTQYVQQLVAVNEYKANYTGTRYSGERSLKYSDGQYYTEEELEYLEKTLQVDVLSTINSILEEELTERGFTLAEVESEERAELTVIEIDTNLSVTARNDAYNPKNLNKTLEEYKAQAVSHDVDYVFDSEEDERLIKAVEALNERKAEDDSEITPSLYIELQQVALQKFERSLLNSHYDSIAEYIEARMGELIKQQLYVDYQYAFGSKVEETEINNALQQKLDYLKAQAIENYTLTPSTFTTLVTGLSSTSFIYDVPEFYQGKYGFVKNLLIPFSEEQTQRLTSISNKFGAESSAYLQIRAELAKEILVTDFIDAPDAEDSEKSNAGFIIEGYEVVGSTFFDSLVQGCTADEFIDLMFRYNTDVAQHNAAYDYVIAKDSPDATGIADSWVKEFAAVARQLANDGTVGGIGYALTSYGVHVIYYSGDVVADEFDWAHKLDNQTGAGTAVYRFYNTYYNSILSTLFGREMDNLQKAYIEDSRIVYHESVMKEYLDGYGIVLNNAE